MIAALLLAAAATLPPARFADPDRAKNLAAAFPEIEKQFAQFVEKQHIPGAAMGIIVDGNLVWLKTAGVRDVAANAPVMNDTIFRIASMTKSFTAMSILKLRDEGKLSLDDPASRYVPELKGLDYPTKDSPAITIRHLLTHSEGFPEDNPWGDRQLARSNATMSAWMQRGIPFSTVPGTAYEYSNYGFAILGQIVARVSKKPYSEYVRDNILRPLGMSSTTYAIPADHFAKGYRWDGKSWIEEPILPDGAFGAMGGLWTTPGDLARYVAFMMSAFPPRDDPESGPIRRSSAREMQQAWRMQPAFVTRRSTDGPFELNAGAYAYGLRIAQDCRFGYSVAHGGGLPGYGSFERWLPDYGVGMIAFGNLTYAGFIPLFNDALAEMIKTGALQHGITQPSQALLQAKDAVSRLITNWDDAIADRIFADNFFLDRSRESWTTSLQSGRQKHGACQPAASIDADNALRGTWRMLCERGWLSVRVTLAPTMPPTVQFLNVGSWLPAPADLKIPANCTADGMSGSTVKLTCDRGPMTMRIGPPVEIVPDVDRDHPCAQ